MQSIHKLSQITTLPEFDLFAVPPTQMTIDKNIVTEHLPISILTNNSPIQFQIQPSLDEYIQLRETSLYMKIKINIEKFGGGNIDATDWEKIQGANTLLHSLFRTVDIEIGGKSLTQNPQTYPYKAYFETYLGFSEESKVGYLSAIGFFVDEDKKKDIYNEMSKFITPTTVTADGKGKFLELMGKLHLDLAFQPMALLGGSKIMITI